MPTCWDTPDQRQSRRNATHEKPYGVSPYEQSSPTPRQYSCWDPSGQHTREAADSRHVLYSVEATVSGGKRTTGPGIKPYLTSYGETSVNKEVDHKRLPITCSKIDHADGNDIRATTNEPIDEVGRTLFFGKTLGAEPKIEDGPFNEEENYDHSAVLQLPSLSAAISCSMTRIVTNGSRKQRKLDADSLSIESEDNEDHRVKDSKDAGSKSFESHPRKRKARKRRQLALQERRIGGGTSGVGGEVSASSDEVQLKKSLVSSSTRLRTSCFA
ncbi:hypothetical protein SASPL_140624 [Salvia splendens]|uniref:Uncharacterized protein n=1 Tax=Salvia splendens TaxID=180675 RepID=A0A8X8ZCN3_SALSN|nr:hypothetical protein SASPL_140624 [Salvia splendens]